MNDISEIKGVGPNTQDKLEKNGLSTVMAIAVTSPAEIASMCGISENKARAIIGEARESLSLGFEKAEDFVKAKGEIPRLTTGCDNFDNMLGGGVKAGGITEIYGQYGSGKSQISHLLVARALMESPEAKVIFLDSEGTFVESRIKDFCEANDVDYEDAMKRIYKYPTGAEVPKGAVYLETVTQTNIHEEGIGWQKCWLVWYYFLVEVSHNDEYKNSEDGFTNGILDKLKKRING